MPNLALIIGQLSWGGAERQLYELAIRIGEHGLTPFVYCLSTDTDPYMGLLSEKNIPVRVFPRRSHFDLGRVIKMRMAFSMDRIDLAHAWLENDNVYTALATIFTHLPWIASMRTRDLHRDLLRRRLDQWAFQQADWIIVNQAEVVTHLTERLQCPADMIQIISNGVNLDRLERSEVGSGEPQRVSTEPLLLFAGRLEAVKRVPLLIEVVARLHQLQVPVKLWIAGQGSLEDSLRQLVREHHLEDHVDFLGVRNDLPTLMRAADLFVLCSETEGLPNVVLEAMGVGTPAVVSPGAGCNDLISPGVDGWIVPDWNVASWVEIIRQVLSDADTRLCVGQNAREKIRNHFRVEQMVSRMAEVYKKILN